MAQMPGEARGYQFAPKQAAGTPAAMVDNFKQIEDLPTLIAMQQRNPSIPLLAHIDEVRKRMEARQAMQSQLAMQQAQQQGPQTLNDQILAGAEQVAGMAPVRRMAAGGIVAFDKGGDTEVKRILAKPPYQRTQEENAKLEAAGIPLVQRNLGPSGNWIERLNNFLESPFFRETFTGGASRLSAEDLKKRTDAGAVTERIARGLGAQQVVAPVDVLQQAFSPEAQQGRVAEGLSRRAAAEGAVPETVPPNATRSAAGTGTGAGTTSTIRNRGVDTTVEKPRQGPPPAAEAPAATDAVTQALNALVAASTTPTEVPQALREQRTKVAGIQELMTKQAMDEAARVRDETDRELARREGRLNKPFLEGDMLPLLASFLSAKKGEFFPSLARGLAAVSTEEEKARKDLAQYRTTEGERVRQLNNTYRQLQLEQAKYEMAWSEGDLKTARESSEKIAKLRYDAAVKTEELKNDRMRTQAEITRANKPTDFELFLRNPERFRDYMGARTGLRDEAALTAANARLTAALNTDPILATLRERAKNEMLTDAQRDTIIQAMAARISQLKIENAPESAALGQATGAAGAAAGTGTPASSDAYNRAVGILKQGTQ